jgi:hypothetical protein
MTDHPPLWIMARRLAPYVARGDVDFTEALDCLMEHIVAKRWGEYSDQLALVEEWVSALLAREAERWRNE